MTEDDFLRDYHEYQTYDKHEAIKEMFRVNSLADDFQVVVVDYEDLGYGLMLKESYDFLVEIGVCKPV